MKVPLRSQISHRLSLGAQEAYGPTVVPAATIVDCLATFNPEIQVVFSGLVSSQFGLANYD